jgi:hypothetical protein
MAIRAKSAVLAYALIQSLALLIPSCLNAQDQSGTLQIVIANATWVVATSDSRRVSYISRPPSWWRKIPRVTTSDKTIPVGEDGICLAEGTIGFTDFQVDLMEQARSVPINKALPLQQRFDQIANRWLVLTQSLQKEVSPIQLHSDVGDYDVSSLMCAGISATGTPLALDYRYSNSPNLTISMKVISYQPPAIQYGGVPQILISILHGEHGFWDDFQSSRPVDRFNRNSAHPIGDLTLERVHLILKGVYDATESPQAQGQIEDVGTVGPPNYAWIIERCGIVRVDLDDATVWKSHCK